MKISYNWLKWYIPEVPEAEKLADVFTYHLCEVESVDKLPDGDTIFDLNILPNRAHDLLSHHGVARELAGQLGIKFNDPSVMYKVPERKPTNLKIEIKTNKCRRYMGCIVRDIKVGPSPEWVVKHLESIGQKSINNIVDATNLCMYDCGQPMHAFDLDKLFSEKIIIREASNGEKMTTLSDFHVELKENEIVISEEGEGILAIAGVKGGVKAEVDEHTKNVVFEVANFDPIAVRKTARRLNILTDSAKRFENDLSPEHTSFGMLELSGLIKEILPDAIFEEIVDVYPEMQKEKKIEFTSNYVNKILGTNIGDKEIEKILTDYSFSFQKNGETFLLTAPYLRLDLENARDIAEEIGRIMGYDKVAPVLPVKGFKKEDNEQFLKIQNAREKLLLDGYSEVMTYAFCKKGSVEVARAPKGKEFLRSNLSDGLKVSYELNRLNAPLIGVEEVKIFEIGTVFLGIGKEEIHVAYADKKGIVEKTLEEFTKEIRGLSTFNFQFSTSNNVFTPWSLFPFIVRDIAVWVPENTDERELINLCKNLGTNLLVREPSIFDKFTKLGRTSLAVRMVFQAFDRTLSDSDILPIMGDIYSEIKNKGWEVR